MRLPQMVYGDSIKKTTQVNFGGYNHTLAAGDGEIYDMENMSSRDFPLLSPRPKRKLLTTLTTPNGIFAKDKLCYVDGTVFYYDGVNKGTVANSLKTFAALGAYIIIMPDKKYYNTLTDAFGDLGATVSGSVTFQDGTLYEEDAQANTIYAEGITWANYFAVGDGVTISGCASLTGNNKTSIVREVSGNYLRFSENCFTNGSEAAVTVARVIPDMDFIFENSNRLWGCKGDTIYCSALGSPFNFNVFDGVDTDSFAVNTGTAGDFTGACTFLGYPVFFKEDCIHKVYGNVPSNYKVEAGPTMGLTSGSGSSLAVAGETLFYLNRTGVVAYPGGIPKSIADMFGDTRYKNAVAGSDGLRYYISMQDALSAWHLFVYDSQKGMWWREDAIRAIGFAFCNNLYCLSSDGKLWIVGSVIDAPAGSTDESAVVSSYVEFGDYYQASPDKKSVHKLRIRAELAAASSLTVYIQYDSSGTWVMARTITAVTAAVKQSYNIPVSLHRCGHYRLKIAGVGDYTIYGITQEYISGSSI